MASGTINENPVKFGLVEVQTSVTVSGGAGAWGSGALPSGAVAVVGFYVDNLFVSLNALNINTISNTISYRARNWSSSEITTNVNVQVLVQK